MTEPIFEASNVSSMQACLQKFSEGGSFDTAGSLGATQGSEALGYLVQNPAIYQFPDTSFKLLESPVFHY